MERERGQVPPHNQKPNSQSKSQPHEQPQQGSPEGNPLAPRTPQSSEHPDSILQTLQERELRRIYRPIQLYDTALQKEGKRLFHEQLLADTPEAKFNRQEFVDRFLQAWDKRMEIREQARADLTPQEREQLDVEDTILKLKGMRTMSSKINRVSKIFRDNEELFYELFLHEPEFTGPIADGWIKRDLRLEKAVRKIRRIQQSRGEDEAQETSVFTGSDLERILEKHAEDLAQEDEDEAQEW